MTNLTASGNTAGSAERGSLGRTIEGGAPTLAEGRTQGTTIDSSASSSLSAHSHALTFTDVLLKNPGSHEGARGLQKQLASATEMLRQPAAKKKVKSPPITPYRNIEVEKNRSIRMTPPQKSGSSGKFRLGIDETGSPLGLKVLYQQANKKMKITELRKAAIELAFLQKYMDPTIYGFTDVKDRIYLALPLMLDFSQFISKTALSPAEAVSYMAMEVSDILKQIHSDGWVHDDVKPQNIFVNTSGSIKLGDYGSVRPKDKPMRTLAQTFQFAPPESVDMACTDPITCVADIWRLGMTILDSFIPISRGSSAPIASENQFRLAIDEHCSIKELRESFLNQPSGSRSLHALKDKPLGSYFYKIEKINKPICHYVLSHMLANNPKDRATASQVASYFSIKSTSFIRAQTRKAITSDTKIFSKNKEQSRILRDHIT